MESHDIVRRHTQQACVQDACRIEHIIQHWRRLRGERTVPCVPDDALSATMMLAPDCENVFRVMVAGALAQRWSGLAFGAAFVSILATDHRRQMTRRLADAAHSQTPSLTRAHTSLLRARTSLARGPDNSRSVVEIDIVLLPLSNARRGGRKGQASNTAVLAGFAPVHIQPAHSQWWTEPDLPPCQDMILDCSGPLPGFAMPVIQL